MMGDLEMFVHVIFVFVSSLLSEAFRKGDTRHMAMRVNDFLTL